jgi:hypothetical protein
MKRIEVKLSLPVVAPLLDVIKTVADTLQGELAAPLEMKDLDHEVREPWQRDLIDAQNADLRTLLALFDSDFFSSGVVAFDEENADAIARACSSVRLRLRAKFLQDVADDLLESGDIEIEALPENVRKAFMCYLFLATIQELIIQHLDSTILEG